LSSMAFTRFNHFSCPRAMSADTADIPADTGG
jgi:hypothetical protein